MRRIVSTEGIVGGSPCIEGTRLTCANVAQCLSPESAESYLLDYPYLTSEDIRNCIEYCARKQCVEDKVINFCQQCTLDTKRNPDPDDRPVEIWLAARDLLGIMNSESKTKT